MKKKVLSLALCLAMLAALTAPASAASTEAGNTVVTKTIEAQPDSGSSSDSDPDPYPVNVPSYEISIPATLAVVFEVLVSRVQGVALNNIRTVGFEPFGSGHGVQTVVLILTDTLDGNAFLDCDPFHRLAIIENSADDPTFSLSQLGDRELHVIVEVPRVVILLDLVEQVSTGRIG